MASPFAANSDTGFVPDGNVAQVFRPEAFDPLRESRARPCGDVILSAAKSAMQQSGICFFGLFPCQVIPSERRFPRVTSHDSRITPVQLATLKTLNCFPSLLRRDAHRLGQLEIETSLRGNFNVALAGERSASRSRAAPCQRADCRAFAASRNRPDNRAASRATTASAGRTLAASFGTFRHRRGVQAIAPAIDGDRFERKSKFSLASEAARRFRRGDNAQNSSAPARHFLTVNDQRLVE